MFDTIQVTQQAMVCWCGVPFSMPSTLYAEYERKNNLAPKSFSIYCPMGHGMTRGVDDEVKRLRDQVTRERSMRDQALARAAEAQAQAGTLERKLKRIHKGTCPECKRSFANVKRHMQTKHART